LIKYIDNRSGHIVGFSNSHQHNYIATQIDQIANGIRDYTEANYPTIYNNPNNTQEAYIDLCIQGLQGTKVFNDYINNLPSGVGIGTISRYLTTDIKCP
jgi:hypothetical protein